MHFKLDLSINRMIITLISGSTREIFFVIIEDCHPWIAQQRDAIIRIQNPIAQHKWNKSL